MKMMTHLMTQGGVQENEYPALGIYTNLTAAVILFDTVPTLFASRFRSGVPFVDTFAGFANGVGITGGRAAQALKGMVQAGDATEQKVKIVKAIVLGIDGLTDQQADEIIAGLSDDGAIDIFNSLMEAVENNIASTTTSTTTTE